MDLPMDHPSLISLIKTMQRSDATAKEQWWNHCDQEGNGVHDPAKHNPEYLRNFITQYNSGMRLQVQVPQDKEALVSTIKSMQRNNPTAKEQWWAYCDAEGGGAHDPAKHEPAFLQNFIFKHRSGVKFAAPGPDFSDQFKDLQRCSPNFKEAWGAYADLYGHGKRDPAKQSKEFMVGFIDFLAKQGLVFLSTMQPQAALANSAAMMPALTAGPASMLALGAPQIVGEPAPKRQRTSADGMQSMMMMNMMNMMGAQGMGAAMGNMGNMGMSQNSPEKQPLVDRIKAYQRMDPTQKEAWWGYCDTRLGGVRDPAKHDLSVLHEFITGYGVP